MLARCEFVMKALSIRCMSVVKTPAESPEAAEVEKIPAESKFRLKLNGSYGTVDYQNRNNTYVLIHTHIPDEHMGKGFGRILAQKTFQYIINEEKRIVLNCEYLQKFYGQNKNKYKAYVDE